MSLRKPSFAFVAGFVTCLAFVFSLGLVWAWLHRPEDLCTRTAEIRTSILDPNPMVREFQGLFPGASPTFGEKCRQEPGPRDYFASFETEHYGRYLLRLEIPFRVSGREVTPSGDADLILKEYTDVQRPGSVTYQSRILSVDDWRRILEARGDLSKALVGIVTDRPVSHDSIVRVSQARIP